MRALYKGENMKFEVNNIETERLILRPFTMEDLDDFVDFRSRPELYAYMIDFSTKTVEEHKAKLQEIVDGYGRESNPSYVWAVVLKETGKVIAKTSIEHTYPKHDRIEIGWSLHPEYQGKGYATEFGKAFLDYLFSYDCVHRIHGFIWEGNLASRKLCEKLGFQFEGTNREARKKNGQYYNVWNMGLLKHEWKEYKKLKNW